MRARPETDVEPENGVGPEPTVDVEVIAQRIEDLLDRIALADPKASQLAEALVRELVGLYGAGLQRILQQLQATAPDSVSRLAEDPLVAGLLVLHDLHPEDVRTRVEAALGRVRPYLASHGGGVQLLAVDDGVVRIRLEGSCDGCSASQLTLRHAVEEAVRAAAPEVDHIEADEPTAPMHPPPLPPLAAGGLIPAESLLVRPAEPLAHPTRAGEPVR